MKLLHLAVAMLAAVLPSSQASAQTLWQNVSSGMSIDDVRAAQPAAASTPDTSALANGATNDLQVLNYAYAGVTFTVSFYFLDSKLVQVAMTAGRRGLIDYESVVRQLRAQHGPATSNRTAIGFETRWQTSDDVNISVIYLSELSRMLRINYMTRPPA